MAISERARIARSTNAKNLNKSKRKPNQPIARLLDGRCNPAYVRFKYAQNPFSNLEHQRIYRRTLRLAALQHYSSDPLNPSCAYCEENDWRILTFDHIEEFSSTKPNRERTFSDGGIGLVMRLIRERWPDGFQVLCFNCQFRKEFVRRNMKPYMGKSNG